MMVILLLLLQNALVGSVASAETLNGRVYYTEGDKAIFAFRWDALRRIVIKVYEGGPAARAGLMKGDKIVAIDGHRVTWPEVRSGDSFIFTVSRHEDLIDLDITAQDPRDIKNPEIHKIWIKN